MKDNSTKYIERYAAPTTAVRCPLAKSVASVAVLIPVYDEPPSFLQRLNALLEYRDILVCVVINHAASADASVKERNRDLLSALLAVLNPDFAELGYGISLGKARAGWLCLIDRCSDGRELLDKNHGVGVARKIAADLLVRWSNVVRCPWILSTDADATVPHATLRMLEAHTSKASALTLPFRHVPGGTGDVDEATQLYEIHLRLYRAGLQAAGSPYAFDSLGSALAVHREAYATARGFPRREGGEDFYLLNKLAKLDGVARLSGEPVRIISRHSQRAPFGTGPAVADILANGLGAYQTYDPRQFVVLRVLLKAAQISVASNAPLRDSFHDLARSSGVEHIAWEAASELLESAGLPGRLADAAARTKSRSAALRRFHDYFDGLRTLQWIHGMQRALPDVPWREALPTELRDGANSPAACCDELFARSQNAGEGGEQTVCGTYNL